MVAGKKSQAETMPASPQVWTSSSGAPSSIAIRVTPTCHGSSSSMVSANIDVVEVRTSPSCRTSRVLSSKATQKAAANTDSSCQSAPNVGLKDATPDFVVSTRRRSSGNIVTCTQRAQLFQRPTQLQGPDSDSDPAPVHPKPSTRDDTSSLEVGIQILTPTSGTVCDQNEAMRAVAADVNAGFQSHVPPIPIDDCTGGVYYLRTKTRRIAAVFKPSDEEPFAPNNPKRYLQQRDGMEPEIPPQPEERDATKCWDVKASGHQSGIRAGIAAGDSAIREVAAYLLDKKHVAGVPTTSLATAFHPVFHYANKPSSAKDQKLKTGAIQAYVPHKCTADDVASTLFSVDDVHAIALLDIRLANQDRHGGNVLVVEQSPKAYRLIPIDHGACLPRVSEMEETSFLWLFWPQAKQSFSKPMRQYIASLNPWEDARMLQQSLPSSHQLEPQALLTLHICTVFLQVCVLEKNMSPYDIGMLMCRHGSFRHQEPKPSVLEQLVTKSLKDTDSSKARSLQHGQDQYSKSVIASFQCHLSSYLAAV